MAIFIKDIKVERIAESPSYYSLSYDNKYWVVDKFQFDYFYDNINDTNKLYNIIKKNFFNEEPTMMFDDSFGTFGSQAWHVPHNRPTEVHGHRLAAIHESIRTNSIGDFTKSYFNRSFWGSLILEDILDDDDV